jgi:hypothetical protein
MYIGYLLPTLISLETKLKSLKPTLKYACPLADAILSGITKRFSGFFYRSDLIMASIMLPQFKLRWLDEAGKERTRSLLYSHVRALQQWEGSSIVMMDQKMGILGRKMTSFGLAIPKQMREAGTQKWICI